MRLHSVKLINYKSFGDSNLSEVIIEPSVAVIIGKNESGKSNVIDGISQISFSGKRTSAFSVDALNRNCEGGGSIIYEVALKSSVAEMQTYHISEDSVAILTDASCLISGGFYELFTAVCGESFAQFTEYATQHPLQARKPDEANVFKKHIQALVPKDKVDTWAVTAALKYFNAINGRLSGDVKGEYGKRIKIVLKDFNSAMSALPTIFYRNDKKFCKVSISWRILRKSWLTVRLRKIVCYIAC